MIQENWICKQTEKKTVPHQIEYTLGKSNDKRKRSWLYVDEIQSSGRYNYKPLYTLASSYWTEPEHFL